MSMGVWDKDPSEWTAYDLHMYAGDANIPAALYKRLQASGVYTRAYKPVILAAFKNRPSLIDSVKTDEEHAELEQWALRDAYNHLVNYGYSMLGGGSQSAINLHMAESRLGWLNMGWRTNLYYQSPFANSMWSWQGKEFRLHNRSDVRQAAAESIVNAVARINSKDDLRVPGTSAYLTVPDAIRDVAQHGSDARPVVKTRDVLADFDSFDDDEPVAISPPTKADLFRESAIGYIFDAAGRTWKVINNPQTHYGHRIIQAYPPKLERSSRGMLQEENALYAALDGDTLVVSALAKRGAFAPVGKPLWREYMGKAGDQSITPIAQPISHLSLAERIVALLPYDYTGITVGVQTGEVGSMGMDLYDNVRGRVPRAPTVAMLDELMASANRKHPGRLVKMYATAPNGVLDALCIWTAKGGFKVPDYGWEASNLRLGGTRKDVAAWIAGRGPNPAHAPAKAVGWIS